MKTKALISFAVTAKLICVFVFAYAKSRFSHSEAHIEWNLNEVDPCDKDVWRSSVRSAMRAASQLPL